MKFVVPYLRVVAGMFAAITLWLAIVEVLNGNLADAILFLAFAAGLGYLAIGKPLRDRRKRIKPSRTRSPHVLKPATARFSRGMCTPRWHRHPSRRSPRGSAAE
ncbi:hypothetical protein NJ76_04755 [Rhodococcus sp. IITR03]|nr:hypothetical protein NJ76_04755 [Rhodococcus sp. IITR03]